MAFEEDSQTVGQVVTLKSITVEVVVVVVVEAEAAQVEDSVDAAAAAALVPFEKSRS